jgi:cell division septum initiation protein DivIVA
MRPTDTGSLEAVGQFEVLGDGKFECRVIDEAGQASQESFSGNVKMVADLYPLVRIIEPETPSLATPTARLPVVVSAEDDCGISRLQLFRSLNGTRPIPADARLPRKWPHRHDERISLPLAGYGLSAGDVIKLFARVEDNDPAGAKGSESPVVVVRIISQEEFERMLRLRQGLEVLASKYHEARRRLEGLHKEAEGLRKKLQKLPPRGALAEETRREIRRLQRLMRRESDALRQAALQRLPFDLDEKLSPELDRLARMTDEMAKALDELQKQRDLLNDDAAKQLEKMLKRLGADRQRYATSAMEPMEHLEAIFPLLIDQERFVVLVLRQQDLVERMGPLALRDGGDDPALRARMRDLEHDQREIRLALDQLLGDIEDHATRLPERPELKKLRETARKFVRDVRASGATAAMTEAEAALAEFAGTRALDKAKLAAQILERFLKRCQGEDGMGSQCRGALVFQPTLANCMGNTIAQLLCEMGFGAGSFSGAGGYGAFGLYGSMGGMSGMASGQYGEPHGAGNAGGPGTASGSSGGGNPDLFTAGDAVGTGTATAAGETTVPVRYQRQVGQYFQRLAEELGNRPADRDRRRKK